MVVEDNKILDEKFKAAKDKEDELVIRLIQGGTSNNTIKHKLKKYEYKVMDM